ncbi:MAG: hypothetical protein HW389_3537 [Bacteroidetes bacterium]|nr:hypothetical protein [Bacteroidota bacterium]
MKIEAEKARLVLAERSLVIAEKDSAIEARDMACRLEKILESFTQHAFEARNDAKSIQLRNEKLSHEIDERQRQLNQREEALQPKEKELVEEQKRLQESRSTVTARELEISRQRGEWETARAKHESETQALAEQAEKTSQETMGRQTEAQRIYSETLVLLRQFWPEFFLVAEWDNWRATLQKEAASSNPNATVLLGAVHVFSAAFQGGQRELLFDCLRQIGILYYRVLKDRGHDENAVSQEADRLARHFNQHSQQRFRLEVAQPGQPTDGSWMNFEPGLTTVGSVSSWAFFIRPKAALATGPWSNQLKTEDRRIRLWLWRKYLDAA